MRRWAALIVLAVATSALAQAPGTPRFNSNFEDPEPWQEQQDLDPPAYPQDENLREFYVSAVATNAYLVDASTLSVGADGVVRYVLVVKTSGGATNVSFEGINCAQRSWKHYASGRSDRVWTKSRASRSEWRPIENKPLNPHHAALSRYFFCPLGNPIASAEEGRNALRLGKHPGVN